MIADSCMKCHVGQLQFTVYTCAYMHEISNGYTLMRAWAIFMTPQSIAELHRLQTFRHGIVVCLTMYKDLHAGCAHSLLWKLLHTVSTAGLPYWDFAARSLLKYRRKEYIKVAVQPCLSPKLMTLWLPCLSCHADTSLTP